MTIVEQIEEVAKGMAEAPDKSKFKSKPFSSGQDDWLGAPIQEATARLIELAKNGCVKAKYTLMNEPFNIKELILGGKVIIQKATDHVHQKPLH